MFYNKLSNEFGLPEGIVRRRLHYVSLPENFNEFEDYVRYVDSAPESHDYRTHRAVEIPPVLIDGVWTQAWKIEPRSEDEVRDNFNLAIGERIRELLQKQADKLSSGFAFSFPDGSSRVQARDQDIRNIQTLVMSALADPSSTFQFRCAENKMHDMTAQDMLDLAKAAQAHVSAIYQWIWQKKEELRATTTFEELAAVELV